MSRRGAWAALIGAGVLAVPVGLWLTDDPSSEVLVPHDGQLIVECAYSHSAPDDPIVYPGEPGRSHRHDFFGATGTDAHTDLDSLHAGDTTCLTKLDRAAYWAPALLVSGAPIEPISSDAYYRAGPGVDPTAVEPYPDGLAMIGGNAGTDGPQPLDHVGWSCSGNGRRTIDPRPCEGATTVHVTFPDCWDGQRLDSSDHFSHMARSTSDGCPASHPVPVPQLEFVVWYPFTGDPATLTLASGSTESAHADFVNAWDPDKLADEVRYCINADLVCGVPTAGQVPS